MNYENDPRVVYFASLITFLEPLRLVIPLRPVQH